MDRNKKVMNLLTRFGIAGQADKLPSQLSGGQKQRVAISRALVNDPKILFADEPVGNLDTKSAGVLLDILRDLNEKEKRTIVLVTHDPRHLVFADRVFYMNDGRIVKKVVNKSKGEMKEEAKDSTGIIASGGRHDKAWKERDEYEELVNKIAMSRKQLAIIERRMALAKYKGNDALEEMLKIEKIDETGELKLLTKSFSDISGLWRPSKFKEFKMKQLAQDLLLNINNVQFKLVKEYVANAVQANTSDGYNALFKMLDAPMKDGGAGLSKTKAIKIAKHTMDIVMAVNFITANDGADGGLRKNVEYLYKLFSTKYSIKDSNQSVLKSKEVIEFRLQNKIDGNDVLRLLDDSFKLGGAGLNRRNAKRIAKDLELILLMKYTPEKEMSTGIDKFGRARQTSFYKQGARVSGK
jgi:energy-coupling factor transporter ATP-binding protein EcfA2